MDKTPNGPPMVERDPDLIEQAKPGHGVPSQDPDPAAQIGRASCRERVSTIV